MLPDFENRSFSEVDRQVFETLSDQQVIRKAQTDVAYRYFLGLRKPDHHYSTPGGVG